MPFNNLSELEFNLIWVGGKAMPDNQAKNLFNFLFELREKNSQVKVWVDTKATYQALVQQMQQLIREFNVVAPQRHTSAPHITFKEHFKHLAYKLISHDALDISPALDDFIENTRHAKLWSGLSDIYRLLILSREYQQDQPHVRFYVEADNLVGPKAWDLFKCKSVAVLYSSQLPKDIGFVPNQIGADIFLLDITSERGINFANSIRPSLDDLLADSELKIYFAELQLKARTNGGLAEYDVLGSYGMINNALFRKFFLTSNAEDAHGYSELLVARKDMTKYFNPLTKMIIDSRSWVKNSNNLEELYDGCLNELCMVRLSELSDVENLSSARTLLELNYPSKSLLQAKFRSLVFLDALRNNQPPPQWLPELSDLQNSESNRNSVTSQAAKLR